VSAELLTLNIPRAEQAKPRLIRITPGDGHQAAPSSPERVAEATI